MKLFAKEQILLPHFVLSYKIDLYFPKYKLAIEVDEKGHKDRKKCDEDEREKAIKELIVNLLGLILMEKM